MGVGRVGSRASSSKPAESPARVVDGVEVVKDEPLQSGLPPVHGQPIYFKTIRLLTLADGRQVYSCADCPDFIGSRGEVRQHRTAAHGAKPVGARKRAPAEDDRLAGTDLGMTLGELLRLAASIGSWEDVLTALEHRAETAEARADAAEKELARMRRGLERAGWVMKGDGE